MVIGCDWRPFHGERPTLDRGLFTRGNTEYWWPHYLIFVFVFVFVSVFVFVPVIVLWLFQLILGVIDDPFMGSIPPLTGASLLEVIQNTNGRVSHRLLSVCRTNKMPLIFSPFPGMLSVQESIVDQREEVVEVSAKWTKQSGQEWMCLKKNASNRKNMCVCSDCRKLEDMFSLGPPRRVGRVKWVYSFCQTVGTI